MTTTTPVRPVQRTSPRLAAGWAFVFAAPHLVWAAGSEVGLRTALSARVVDDGGLTLRIANLAIALFCITGAAVALNPGGRLPRRVRLPLLWFGAVLLAGRAVDIYVEFGRALTGLNPIPAEKQAEFLELSRWFLFGYLPWFTLRARPRSMRDHGSLARLCAIGRTTGSRRRRPRLFRTERNCRAGCLGTLTGSPRMARFGSRPGRRSRPGATRRRSS